LLQIVLVYIGMVWKAVLGSQTSDYALGYYNCILVGIRILMLIIFVLKAISEFTQTLENHHCSTL